MLHQKIGNYYLDSELGSGGFGRVYRGRHNILTEREVAVKILHSFINTLEEREQFLQEAHLLERLKHPHILHIFDVGVNDGFPYIVSAFANEGSLADLLKMCAPHPLPEDVAIGIIAQVGAGLLYAHQQQVIHRDLKPENILFDHGIAFLADFGIAVTLATASVKNVTITGTPPYMAPEQFQGQVSKESDQYGLACIAYELVTGHQPFTAPDFFSMGFQHLSTPPTPPSQYNPNISPHVERAILKAMSKQRTERFDSLQDFLSALRPDALLSSSSSSLPATLYVQTHPTTAYASMEEGLFRTPVDESDLLTLPSRKNEAIPRQTPVTPVLFTGLPDATPPHPMTPVPHSFDVSTDAFKTQRSTHSRYQTVLPTKEQRDPTLNAFPFTDKPFEIPEAPFVSTTKQRTKRKFITGISFGLIACLVGLLVFATVSHASNSTPLAKNSTTLAASSTAAVLPTNPRTQPQGTKQGSSPRGNTGGTTSSTRTTSSTTTGVNPAPTSPATGITVTPGATATQGQATSPATNPTQAPTATATTAPIPTDTPVPTPTDTPVPTPTDTPVPTPTPTSPPVVGTTETVYAYFTGGSYSVQTANSYSGTVQISVSGVGQAYDVSCYSDAFYVYTDQSGNAITPFHDSTSPNWVMTINGEHTDYFVSLPAYNSSHTYTFTMTAPGGMLSFGVDDNVTSDDTGSYTVTVTQE